MYEKFVWMLVLADWYIEYQMNDYSDKFEYFYDMRLFVVVYLLLNSNHESFSLSKVLKLREKMAGYDEFKSFEKFERMNNKTIDLASNYACLQLNNPGSNYRYYYDMYSYITKCKIVLQTYKETQFGEAICEGELVNFLKEEKHKKCSCSSVYYKVVFN